MRQKHSINWTQVDSVLCTTEKLLPTNKRATCAGCGRSVYYNSSIPQDVPKLCPPCALETAQHPKRPKCRPSAR